MFNLEAEQRPLTALLTDQRLDGSRAQPSKSGTGNSAEPVRSRPRARLRAYQLTDMIDTVVLGIIIILVGVIACGAIAGIVLVLPSAAALWL